MLCILERIHRWTGDILDPVRRAGPTHSGYKELETEATQYIDAGKGENSNSKKFAEGNFGTSVTEHPYVRESLLRSDAELRDYIDSLQYSALPAYDSSWEILRGGVTQGYVSRDYCVTATDALKVWVKSNRNKTI